MCESVRLLVVFCLVCLCVRVFFAFSSAFFEECFCMCSVVCRVLCLWLVGVCVVVFLLGGVFLVFCQS